MSHIRAHTDNLIIVIETSIGVSAALSLLLDQIYWPTLRGIGFALHVMDLTLRNSACSGHNNHFDAKILM
jgi:hypothetical protein